MRIFLLTICLLTTTWCRCAPGYIMQQYHVANSGLQSNTVYAIAPDKNGDVYFATERGVYRYNGTGMQLLNLGNYTYDIYLNVFTLAKGGFWLLPFRSPMLYYNNGRYYPALDSIQSQNRISASVTYGYEEATGALHFLTRQQQSQGHHILDADGRLTGTSSDISFYEHFITMHIKDPVIRSSILSIVKDYISKAGYPIYRELRVFDNRYLLAAGRVFDLMRPEAPLLLDIRQYGLHGFVTSVLREGAGLWLSVTGDDKGLYLFEPDSAGSYRKPEKIYSLDDVSFVARDRYDNIWFSTLNRGIFKIRACDRYVQHQVLKGKEVFVTMEVLANEQGILATDSRSDLWRMDWNTGREQLLYRNEQIGNGSGKLLRRSRDNGFLYFAQKKRCITLNASGSISSRVRGLLETQGLKYSALCGNDIYWGSNDVMYWQRWGQPLLGYLQYSLTERPRTICAIGDTMVLLNTGARLLRLYTDTFSLYFTPPVRQGEPIQFVGAGRGNIIMASGTQLFGLYPDRKMGYQLIYSTPDQKYILAAVPYGPGYICMVKDGFTYMDESGKLLGSYVIPEGLLKDEIKLYELSGGYLFLSDGNGIFKIPVDKVIAGQKTPEARPSHTFLNHKELPAGNEVKVRYRRNQTLLLEYDLFETGIVAKNIAYTLSDRSGKTLINGAMEGRNVSLNNLAPGKYQLRITALHNGRWLKLSSRSVVILPQWYQQMVWQLLATLVLLLLLGFLGLKIWQWLYRRRMKRERTRERLLQLESQSRLNQLKPHFIFNALTPIQNHILMGREEKALDCLNDFSILMRNMLEASDQASIPLQSELIFLDKYLLVQQGQHSGNFDYRFINEIAEDRVAVLDIPALLLQPLVENAVVHGVAGSRTGGSILVHLQEREGYLFLSVSNNLPPDITPVMPVFRQGHALTISRERIQLMNIHKDPRVGMFFECRPGSFTSTIVLPVSYQ